MQKSGFIIHLDTLYKKTVYQVGVFFKYDAATFLSVNNRQLERYFFIHWHDAINTK